MEYYSTMRKEEILLFVMNFENIIINETSQRKASSAYHLYRELKIVKLVKKKERE